MDVSGRRHDPEGRACLAGARGRVSPVSLMSL